jgi:hypothetical protein
LAIWRGIQRYYSKRGRQVPTFADFRNPKSRAWRYADTWGDPQGVSCLADLALFPEQVADSPWRVGDSSWRGEGRGAGDDLPCAVGATTLAAGMLTETDPLVGPSRALTGASTGRA